jgi:hypothetical protein
MRHLISFKLFEEINPKDIYQVSTEFDDYFTVSFEFEIETLDTTNIKLNFSDFDEDVAEDVISIVKDDMNSLSRSSKSLIKKLVYELLDYVEGDYININRFNEIFDDKRARNDEQVNVIRHTKATVMSFIGLEDLTHLKKMVKEYLPNFYRNWYRKIEYVGDATLDRGIEIKPKTYLRSISESIKMINDFFTDLKSQEYWVLSERTGLHINIGTKTASEWNPIKGLLLLNDLSKSDNIPLVFKDMTWRMNNNFCGSLLPSIYKMTEQEKHQLKQSVDLRNIPQAESILNQFLTSKIKSWGIKNFGFNISKLESNYVEYRYVGGVIDLEIVIEKLKYFSFITYCMTNKDYKRKEYLKKLYTFLESI